MNGRIFARTKAIFDEYARQTGRECEGYFRRQDGGVLLLKPSGEIFACVINNRHGRGIVTARKDDKNRIWYMNSTTRHDEAYLGLSSFSTNRDMAESVINQLTRQHWYVDIRALASDIAHELRMHPDRWMPTGMCRLDDGSEHNPLFPLPRGRHVRCCTLESHITLRSPEGDHRCRGWYADREFYRRAGFGYPQGPLWQWEVVPGRTVADVIALCERVAADPAPDLEFGIFPRESAEALQDVSTRSRFVVSNAASEARVQASVSPNAPMDFTDPGAPQP